VREAEEERLNQMQRRQEASRSSAPLPQGGGGVEGEGRGKEWGGLPGRGTTRWEDAGLVLGAYSLYYYFDKGPRRVFGLYTHTHTHTHTQHTQHTHIEMLTSSSSAHVSCSRTRRV